MEVDQTDLRAIRGEDSAVWAEGAGQGGRNWVDYWGENNWEDNTGNTNHKWLVLNVSIPVMRPNYYRSYFSEGSLGR